MTSRRSFLQKTALAAAATALSPAFLQAAAKKKYLIGIQLYSVRADMKTDPLGTLKALADMGYQHVEHANYVDRKFYGYSAKEFKQLLSYGCMSQWTRR